LKRSAYVMGSLLKRLGDKLLSWALSFKVINRIFAGGFGVTLGEVLGVKPEEEVSKLSEAIVLAPYILYQFIVRD